MVIKESESLNLISALGETMLLGDADVEDCMKFIQTTLYAGCEEETYVETRIRLYKKQKQKISMNLPPDADCCRQAIFRAHYQAYYWTHCLQSNIPSINFEDNGWSCHEESGIGKLGLLVHSCHLQ